MMFDFEPTEEQQMLVDWIKRFAMNDLRLAAHEADETGELPESLIEKGWELGILQGSIPEDYGGFGERSLVTAVLAAEELAWGDMAAAVGLMTPALFVIPILLCGSEPQKVTFISSLIGGEWQPFTAAMIEPNYDYDPLSLRTIAEENKDGYLISGHKTFVPFADVADAYIVYANCTGKTQGFIVHKEALGVEVVERNKWLGINGVPTFHMHFDNVLVPREDRLGGSSGHDFAPILDASRVVLASMAVGIARAAFEYSRDYAKEREAFGVKIAQKQSIAFMLAEMATEIEAVRLLAWEAAWMMDKGKSCASKQAYLAISGAMDMAMMVTDRAVQILGGHGYIREHPVERWMRNGRGIGTWTGLVLL
jgi:alkylation response protein AidB-like acyl-CoA dehydrogenase